MVNRIIVLIALLSITKFEVLARAPWTIFEDFSSADQYGNLNNWSQLNDNTLLDLWPDWRTGNQTIQNNRLSFLANDEAEQNGLIYLKPPTDYNHNDNNWVYGTWRITPNTIMYPSWSASFKVNLNPHFMASATNGIVEGGLLIRNQWSGFGGYSNVPKQGYWTAFGIDANGRKYLATDMFGSGTSSDYYLDSTLTSSEVYIKVVFDSDLLTLSSYFTEDLSNPGYYWSNPFRTESIQAWGDLLGYIKQDPSDYLKELNIGLGGYSANTTVPDGTVTMDDFSFNLVPEPSSLSLLLAGGAVLMAGRRRKV